MLDVKFKYDYKDNWLAIEPVDPKYIDVGEISNWNWTSERVEEDIAWAEECNAGTFVAEDGQDFFLCGFEHSPGIIEVYNNDKAYVVNAREGGEPLLVLELNELIDLLTQMRDFLKGIGK